MSIITVNWGDGAVHPYSQATANTRLVAAKMSRLIKMMKIHPQKVHIIGYSLGAHIAGYVGENLKDIGRITGERIFMTSRRHLCVFYNDSSFMIF